MIYKNALSYNHKSEQLMIRIVWFLCWYEWLVKMAVWVFWRNSVVIGIVFLAHLFMICYVIIWQVWWHHNWRVIICIINISLFSGIFVTKVVVGSILRLIIRTFGFGMNLYIVCELIRGVILLKNEIVFVDIVVDIWVTFSS